MEIAISPCPNDTFAFYSLIQAGKYDVTFLDIEELNRALIAGKYAIAKGSFAIMEKIGADYEILETGAAIGKGVGPVLVSKQPGSAGTLKPATRVALPGENTTAHKLFRYWLDAQTNPHPEIIQMPFYEMFTALKSGTVDAAVLIHEGRFVYATEGLQLIADLGAFWEQQTGSMIPLGCIYAKKNLPQSEKDAFTNALRHSIDASCREYAGKSAFYNDTILPYLKTLAQESEARVVEAHVDTYVTSDTRQLTAEALKSIDVFREKCRLLTT